MTIIWRLSWVRLSRVKFHSISVWYSTILSTDTNSRQKGPKIVYKKSNWDLSCSRIRILKNSSNTFSQILPSMVSRKQVVFRGLAPNKKGTICLHPQLDSRNNPRLSEARVLKSHRRNRQTILQRLQEQHQYKTWISKHSICRTKPTKSYLRRVWKGESRVQNRLAVSWGVLLKITLAYSMSNSSKLTCMVKFQTVLRVVEVQAAR